MRSPYTGRLARTGRRAIAAAITVLATAGVAQAQTNLVGNSDGCFSAGGACTPTTNATWESGALTFAGRTNATFGQFVGSTFVGNPVDLGTLTLTRMQGISFNGDVFRLLVTFTSPTPGDNGTYTAALTGSLNNGGNGSVFIDFGGPQAFNVGGNAFELTVADRTLMVSGSNSPDVQHLEGTIRMVSTVPEPASVALLGTGLVALVGIGAHRRRTLA